MVSWNKGRCSPVIGSDRAGAARCGTLIGGAHVLKVLAAVLLATAVFGTTPSAYAAANPAQVQNRPAPTLHIECSYEPLIGGWACYRFNEDGSFHSFWIRWD